MNISLMFHNFSVDFNNEDEISKFSDLIEDTGYYSLLCIYHSLQKNYLVPIIRTLKQEHSFKHLLAIRSFLVSPEYLYTIIREINDISRDRIMLNVLAGDIHKAETSVNDIVYISDKIDTMEKRNVYAEEWLKKYKNIDKDTVIFCSGHSDQTIDISNKYADGVICSYGLYSEDFRNKANNVDITALIMTCIMDSEEQAFSYIEEKYPNKCNGYRSTIYGTEREVINKIKLLRNEGISHVMMFPVDTNDRESFLDQESKMHLMAKKLIKELKDNNI